MAADWLTIRNDYINGGGSYRKLAEKYGVKFSVLKDVAVKEKWKEAREEQANKTRTKTEQKTAEKISDALSDEAALKVRLRCGFLKMAAEWMDKQKGITDTGDFRRMVQSCIELGILDSQNGDEIENDGLLDALDKVSGSLFMDGDDSHALPKEKEE